MKLPKMKSILWYRAEQTCLDAEKCVPSKDKIPQVSCNTQCLVDKTYKSVPQLEEVQHYKDMAKFFQDGMHVANNKLKVANDTLNATKRTLDVANDALNATINRLKSCISANSHLLAISKELEKELSDVRAQLLQQKECENVLPDDIVAEIASTTKGINEKQNVHRQTNCGNEIELQVRQTTLCNNEAMKRIFSSVNNTIEECEVALMPQHKKMKQECLCPCVKFCIFFNLHSASKLLVLCKYVCVVLDNDEHCVTPFVSRIPTAPRSKCLPSYDSKRLCVMRSTPFSMDLFTTKRCVLADSTPITTDASTTVFSYAIQYWRLRRTNTHIGLTQIPARWNDIMTSCGLFRINLYSLDLTHTKIWRNVVKKTTSNINSVYSCIILLFKWIAFEGGKIQRSLRLSKCLVSFMAS